MPSVPAALKLVAFLALTALLIPVQAVLLRWRSPLAKRLPVHVHRLYCRILQLEVVLHGSPAPEAPVLFVANHTSWIDILVLSTFVPVSFVAKHEVENWPFFGLLARLQRTVFVERRVARTAEHRDEMGRRLEAGDNLLLFAEGTSNDGNRVLPFKSAFFAVAESRILGRPLLVQPVSIAYTRLDGLPIGRRLRHRFAWYGDMDLVPHIWTVLRAGKLTVEVEFHQTITIEEAQNRKQLALRCQRAVAVGVARAISGRRDNVDASAAGAAAGDLAGATGPS